MSEELANLDLNFKVVPADEPGFWLVTVTLMGETMGEIKVEAETYQDALAFVANHYTEEIEKKFPGSTNRGNDV